MRPTGDHRNGAIVYYDGHLHRIVDAQGKDAISDRDEFTALPVDDTTGDPTEWTTTPVEVGAGASTATQADRSGGALLLTTAAGEDDGINLQKNGRSWSLAAGNLLAQRLIVGPLDEVVESDLFAGLSVPSTDILGGVTDRVGVESLDGSDVLSGVSEKNGVQTAFPIGALVAGQAHEVEIYFNGLGVYFYFDGVATAPWATNVPDDVLLRKSLQFLTGEAVAHTAEIGAFDLFQIGRN